MVDPQPEGRVVLVTGVNHGIGAATARAFAAQGARVFITIESYSRSAAAEMGRYGSWSTSSRRGRSRPAISGQF